MHVRTIVRCRGYSIGRGCPSDWGARTMILRPANDTPLRAGMTFRPVPGPWFEDWSIEIAAGIVVAAPGGEPLANVPPRLFVRE